VKGSHSARSGVGDVFAVLDAEARAVNERVALLLAVLFIDDGDQSGAVHGDGSAPRPSTNFMSTN